MRVFVQIAAQVTGALSPRSESIEETTVEVHRTHARIAEAILDGDAEAAERRMRRHLETVVRDLTVADGPPATARRVVPSPARR